MIRLGLVGYPLSHSLSPRLHLAALKALAIQGEYILYTVAPDEPGGLAKLTNAMHAGEIQGLNVTIPYKQTIIPLVDMLTPTARAIGAVNTLFIRNKKLFGDNTDASGFMTDLAKSLKEPVDKRGLVIGAGGAARAVVYALLKNHWKITLAVRQADVEQANGLKEAFGQNDENLSIGITLLDAENLARISGEIKLIVNTTPVGMYPDIDYSPWPTGLPFPNDAAVYDVVYNPRQTKLVREARLAGLQAMTGLGMLIEQAALSFACWTGREVPREIMDSAVEA